MNWKTTASAASLAVFIASASSATAAEGPKVAASILPLHSFAQQLLGQAGELELLLPPAVSPHGFTLKPSQRRAIEEAQILYWVGPSLERPIEKILESSPVQQKSVPLEDRDAGLAIHSFREGHGDHHEGHGHEDEHEDDHGHEEGAIDPHIWLSLDNARKIMQLIGEDFFKSGNIFE